MATSGIPTRRQRLSQIVFLTIPESRFANEPRIFMLKTAVHPMHHMR